MANLINEAKRFQKLAGIINEDMATGYSKTLNVEKETNENGNTQVTLNIIGGGWEENQLTLSIPEAKKLVELGEKFIRERKLVEESVNTPGKDGKSGAQSTLQIKPDGLNCTIGRLESFGGGRSYKGYYKELKSSADMLTGPQSIVYQIVEKLGNQLHEDATSAPAPTTNAPADVKALGKAQSAATTVQTRAKAINNINEFAGAFESWIKTLGIAPGKISKSALRTQVEKILTNLGYK